MIDTLVFDNCIKSRDKIYYLVMLDYDDISETELLKDIKKLQSRYRLSEASMYTTRHGYHVIFFYDHIPSWKQCMKIILDSCCDPKFKEVAVNMGKVNTRISNKYMLPDKHFFVDIPPIHYPIKDEDISAIITEGNKIRELYEKLMDIQLAINH